MSEALCNCVYRVSSNTDSTAEDKKPFEEEAKRLSAQYKEDKAKYDEENPKQKKRKGDGAGATDTQAKTIKATRARRRTAGIEEARGKRGRGKAGADSGSDTGEQHGEGKAKGAQKGQGRGTDATGNATSSASIATPQAQGQFQNAKHTTQRRAGAGRVEKRRDREGRRNAKRNRRY